MRCLMAMMTIAMLPAAARAQATTTDPPRFTPTGPSFVALRVADVDAAADWYSRVFSLRQASRMDADDGAYSIRLLSDGDMTVELIEQPGIERPEDAHLGLFKTGFFVSDVDALFARLRDLGVVRDENIFFDEALNVRSFVFRDLEGNRLQAFQRCSAGC